jgi:hypothetical protein
MMKTHKIFFALAAVLAAALASWSCDMVALGTRLDLEAPRLTLTRPDFAATVPEVFELAGTVTDEVKTTLLTVRMEKGGREKIGREWRNNRGAWQIREAPDAPWQPCPGQWNLSGTTAYWSLQLSLEGIPSGDYVIIVDSFDEYGNHDAGSIRQVKITYINENPVFTLLNPVLKTGTNNHVPDSLAVMDDATRFNPALFGELYNDKISLDYRIDGGDFSGGGELILRLVGPPLSPTDLDDTGLHYGEVWYKNSAIAITNTGWTGSFVIPKDAIRDALSSPASGRTPLRLISEVTDTQGKEETKALGWLMWWPESDQPWAQISATSDPTANPYTKLYGDRANIAFAYDDDGLASLTCRIREWDRAGQNLGALKEEKTIPFPSGGNQSEWSFTMPDVPGDYCIEAAVTDTGGATGTTYAYITVIKKPAIEQKFLTRISAANADGAYGAGAAIDIVLYFDVPIDVTGTPAITLNITNAGSTTRYAAYVSGSGSKALTFRYTVQEGDQTPGGSPLDVTALPLGGGGLSYRDSYGDPVNINSAITLPVDTDARLAAQKTIYVVKGKPAVSSTALNAAGVLTVNFAWPDNPSHPWNLLRGSGNLALKIVGDDYRVPAVISEARYTSLGLKGQGDPDYYERTINGANSDGSAADTDPKYVLKFNFDTATFGVAGSDSDSGRQALWYNIREAEAITLLASSSRITLSGPTMTVDLTDLLPVRGVHYGLTIDEGFLMDSFVGVDTGLVADTILRPGVEPPVFRVEKKDEGYSTTKKQAEQPVTTQVKLDCRTPGAEIWYTDPGNAASYKTDPVDDLLFEQQSVATPGTRWHLKPKPLLAEIGGANVPNVKADEPVWKYARGASLPPLHTPVKSDALRSKAYTVPFTIGNTNYALGGMVYRLGAVAYPPSGRPGAATPSAPTYELAYRSVLVFNNTETPGYSSLVGAGIFRFPPKYRDGNNIRIWIMGGDSTSGAVITPGFPLSWTEAEKKIRLMTPVGTAGTVGGNINNTTDPYTNIGGHTNTGLGADTTLTNAHIPASYNVAGNYTWYWVTWKLGNAAYIQFQRRALSSPSTNANFDTETQYISNLKQGWNDSQEYYPVFPGETRVVNPVTPYWYRESDSNRYQYYKVLGQRESSTRWHPLSPGEP